MTTIIDIDHEAGNLSEWTSLSDAGGDLSASNAAALAGSSFGMACRINGTDSFYAEYQLGASNTSGVVRVRFYFDPNSLTMANNQNHFIGNMRSATTNILTWRLGYTTANGHNLVVQMIRDADSVQTTAHNFTDAPHYIEVRLVRATTNVSADGTLDLWVDGVHIQQLTGDNFDTFNNFRTMRLGNTSGIDATTSGTYYIDEIKVNDDGSEIGAAGGSPVTIVLDTSSLTATGRITDAVPGAVSKLFDTALLTITPQTLDVQQGAVTKLLDTAMLTVNGRLLDVVTISLVTLDTSSITANGRTLQVIKGQAIVELDEALLLSSGQDISFIVGSVLLGIDTASLIANGNIIGLLIGGDILLDTANLSALGIQSNVNVGEVTITFDVASVVSSANMIDLTPGAVNLVFDTANVQSVAQISNVNPGEYVVTLDTAATGIVSYDITITAPFTDISVLLDSALLQVSSEIAIMPGNVLISFDTALLLAAAPDVVISALLAVVKHWTLSDRSTLLSVESRSTLLSIEERNNELTLNEDDR